MIHVSNLTFGFDDRLLFEDVALDLPARGLVAVTGPNGVGKTTLLRVLGGIYRSGVEVRDDAGRPARLTYVDDGVLALDSLSVAELVELCAAELPGLGAGRLRDSPLLGDALRGTRVGALSLGQRQRVVVALACSVERADGLLLDEPFNALDAEGARVARAELAAVARTRPVLFASHLAVDVEDFADHVLQVDAGRLQLRDASRAALDAHR